jgi:hypothetical protein
VQEYSQRFLSFESDRLIAIAGLADMLSNLLKDKYFAGMWRGELLDCLQWTAVPMEPYYKSRRTPYCAPTWSWASIDMTEPQTKNSFFGIFYDHSVEEENLPLIKIIDATWTCSSLNVFGDLASARLVIQERPLRGRAYSSLTGPDLEATYATMTEHLEGVPELAGGPLAPIFPGKTSWYVHVSGETSARAQGLAIVRAYPDIWSEISEGVVYLLPLCQRRISGSQEVFCLVLRELAGATFERVGWSRTVPWRMPKAREREMILV